MSVVTAADDLAALTPRVGRPVLVYGLGISGRAVARALRRRGHEVLLADDQPGAEAQNLATELGAVVEGGPSPDRVGELVAAAACVVPSPGLPEWHPAVTSAAAAGVPLVGELDLASLWDDRPCVAITGTDGKTTVTTLVTRMLAASGLAATDAGNTEVPLVQAIDDPSVQVFVVEASSFRLAPLRRFRPLVGTWLNFADDHLDVHRDLASYEAAKARIWSAMGPDQLAVANADDPIVMRHTPGLPRVETFGLGRADWHVAGGELRAPDGTGLLAVDDLPRRFPHDLANALAAAATAIGGGATLRGVRDVLREFTGLPHRVELVGEAGGVRWFDDSKATTPHAVLTALQAFDSAVLVAGGQNKGLDLGLLAGGAAHVRAVVAIGAAAPEVAAAFEGVRPVRTAATMDEAVALAADLAAPGDSVLLSPGCASFDAYTDYRARGDDFARAVRDLLEAGR